jgi:hypothetical protein
MPACLTACPPAPQDPKGGELHPIEGLFYISSACMLSLLGLVRPSRLAWPGWQLSGNDYCLQAVPSMPLLWGGLGLGGEGVGV